MDLSSQMINLKAFIHTSTYFVNNNLPRNTPVMEKIYPLALQLNGKSVSHDEYVSAVMNMQPAEANQITTRLMQVSRPLVLVLYTCTPAVCLQVLQCRCSCMPP